MQARAVDRQGNYNKMSRDQRGGRLGISDAKKAKFVACISESCRFETCLTYSGGGGSVAPGARPGRNVLDEGERATRLSASKRVVTAGATCQ